MRWTKVVWIVGILFILTGCNQFVKNNVSSVQYVSCDSLSLPFQCKDNIFKIQLENDDRSFYIKELIDPIQVGDYIQIRYLEEKKFGQIVQADSVLLIVRPMQSPTPVEKLGK
jgi:hypothetical protein